MKHLLSIISRALFRALLWLIRVPVETPPDYSADYWRRRIRDGAADSAPNSGWQQLHWEDIK